MKKLSKKILETKNAHIINDTIWFHGTNESFENFDLRYFNAGSGDGGWLGRGVYFTNDIEYAESYGLVLECSVAVDHPYVIKGYDYSKKPNKLSNELGVDSAYGITLKLKKQGFDSVLLMYEDKDMEGGMFYELCVFDPENVVINKA